MQACCKAERGGFEPPADSNSSAEPDSFCELCQAFNAANVLHSDGIQCLQATFADVNLQEVVLGWNSLKLEVREEIVELVREQNSLE